MSIEHSLYHGKVKVLYDKNVREGDRLVVAIIGASVVPAGGAEDVSDVAMILIFLLFTSSILVS